MEAQFEVLRPFVTERIQSLVRGRLLEGIKFFHDNALSPEFSRGEVKLVLLLIQIANPNEFLNANETAFLEGRQRKLGEFKANLSPVKAQIGSSAKTPKKRS